MMPTEMELRVAKAIYARRTKANPETVAEHFHWHEQFRRDPASMVHASTVAHAIADARAAIRAMREPTDAQACAGQWSQFDTHNPPVQRCVDAKLRAIKIWRAMIDAATSVEPEPR